jgi:hypothetical protein
MSGSCFKEPRQARSSGHRARVFGGELKAAHDARLSASFSQPLAFGVLTFAAGLRIAPSTGLLAPSVYFAPMSA